MSDQLRSIYLAELASNVRQLTGGQFEQFCYCLMEAVQPGQWTHRGTTSEGAPVGYVVDSSAQGAKWVGQYSSEQGYFDAGLEKLNKDLTATIKKHPQVTHLWMFSNKERGPSQVTEVQNWIAAQEAAGRTIRVLDVRDIATEVYERLDVDQLVEAASPFLPFLEKIHDEWALTHRVPSFEGYIHRPMEETQLANELKSHRVAVAAGISGFGKSAIASCVAAKLQGSYDSIFWLDAAGIRAVEELNYVEALRNGRRYNLLGVARQRRCLLVLDDLKVDLPRSTLLNQLGAGSAVLVTTQFALPDAVSIGGVNEQTARQILEASLPSKCPDEVFEQVFRRTVGHPLLLSVLNRVAKERTPPDWTQILALCSTPVDVEDADHNLLGDRILKHHLQAARFAIAAVAWLGGPSFDPAVLKSVGGGNAQRALRSRNLLTASAPGLERMHDLVFAAVTRVTSVSSAEAENFRRAFCDFLGECIAQDVVELRRIAAVHRALIERLLRERSHPALRYAYALPRASESDLALFGDPAVLAELASQSSTPEVDVRSLIECVEARFSISNRISHSLGQESLRRDAPALEVLLRSPGLPEKLRTDIAYHRAKSLLWQGTADEAETGFNHILESAPDHAASRLQLARMLSQKRPPDRTSAVAHAEAIFQLLPESVSETIALGALEVLRGPEGTALLKERATQITALLARSSAAGLDQPFDVLADLARDLWYLEPELLEQLADALPNRISAPSSDKDWFAWAQLRKSLAKTRLGRGAAVDDVRALLEEARDAYAAMEHRKPFEVVQAAECLVLLSEAKDALALLETVAQEKREAHWYHRQAQALRLEGRFQEGLQAIAHSLGQESAAKYAAAFHEEQWKLRRASGDPDAIASLRKAVGACDPKSKYAEALLAQLRQADAGG